MFISIVYSDSRLPTLGDLGCLYHILAYSYTPRSARLGGWPTLRRVYLKRVRVPNLLRLLQKVGAGSFY